MALALAPAVVPEEAKEVALGVASAAAAAETLEAEQVEARAADSSAVLHVAMVEMPVAVE